MKIVYNSMRGFKMINKEQFVKLINEFMEWNEGLNKIYETFKFEPMNVPCVEYGSRVFGLLLELCFDEYAQNLIYWWTLERKNNIKVINDMYSDEWNAIKTVDDLWEHIKIDRLHDDY